MQTPAVFACTVTCLQFACGSKCAIRHGQFKTSGAPCKYINTQINFAAFQHDMCRPALTATILQAVLMRQVWCRAPTLCLSSTQMMGNCQKLHSKHLGWCFSMTCDNAAGAMQSCKVLQQQNKQTVFRYCKCTLNQFSNSRATSTELQPCMYRMYLP